MQTNQTNQLFSVRFAVIVTLIAVFCLPLVYSPALGTYTALRYFFFGTCCLLLALATTKTWLLARWIVGAFFKKWFAWGLLVYFAAFLIVSFTSVDVTTSFWSSFQRTDGAFTMLFLTIFALNIFTLVMVNGKTFIRSLLAASVLGAIALTLLLIFSPGGIGSWFPNPRGGATVGNSSLAASYVLWNIFFSVVVLAMSRSRRAKLVWGLITLILLSSPLFLNWPPSLDQGAFSLLGQARGAILGLMFGAVISLVCWLLLQQHQLKKRLGLGLLIITVISLFAITIQLFNQTSNLHQKFVEATGKNRFIFWNTAWEGFEQRPILGWGPSNYNIPYHKFFDAKMLLLPNGEIWVDKAHNLFLESLVTGGVLLTAALAFLLLTLGWAIARAYNEKNSSALETSLYIGAPLGWLIQAQFVFDSILSLAMLFILAGVLYALVALSSAQPNKLKLGSDETKVFVLSTAAVAVLILFIYSIVLPFQKARTLYGMVNAGPVARTAGWQGLKDGLSMGNGYDSALLFSKLYEAYGQELPKLASAEPKQRQATTDELTAICNYLFDLTEQKPHNSHELTLLGARFYYLLMSLDSITDNTVTEKAKRLAERAIQFSASNPATFWIAAQIESRMPNPDKDKIKKLLEQSLAVEPDLPATHTLILELAKRIDDQAYYDSSLKRAKETIPNFVN